MMWSQEEDADESKELQKKKKQVWHPEKSKRKPVTFSRSDIRSWHWSWNHMDSHCCLQVITSIATCIGERPEMNLKLQNSGVPASQIMSWSKDADHKSQAQTCKHFAQSIGATPLEGMTGWWRLWPKIWITVQSHCVVVARPWRVRLTKLRCPSTADLIESNIYVTMVMAMVMTSRDSQINFCQFCPCSSSNIIEHLKVVSENTCFDAHFRFLAMFPPAPPARFRDRGSGVVHKRMPSPVNLQSILLKRFPLNKLLAMHCYLIYKCESCLLLDPTRLTAC